MKKSSLIGHTVELLDLIRPLKQPADAIVRDFFRTRHYLGSKDRRFVSESIYNILRNYRLLRFHSDEGMKKCEIERDLVPSLVLYISYALRIQQELTEIVLADVQGAWRLSFPRIECSSVLDAIAKSELPVSALHDPIGRIAYSHSFPDSIVAEWISRFGETEADRLCQALNQPAPTSLRVNTLKASVEKCQARLKEEGIESERTKLSPHGLVLDKRVNIQALQSFRDGWFEMQDEGSQLISMLLTPRPGAVVVDACAGGGGKTLHLAALMKNDGEVHSIDIDEKRLISIRPRLERAGVRIVRLLHDERDRSEIGSLREGADMVLVDAPCSGVGTFRRNPALKLSFSEEYVGRISALQRSILEKYSTLVKPGGLLVYSTCTLLRRENEDVAESFLNSHPEFSSVSATEILRQEGVEVGISTNHLQLFPHKTGTDGFFAAVLQKRK